MALFFKHRIQFTTLAIMLLGFLGAMIVLNHYNSSIFRRFLGNSNPMLIGYFMVFLAAIIWPLLISRGWFVIHTKYPIKKALPYVALTVLFASVAILIDINIVYPADMNIPFPESLLFYPVIAFLVEIIFHVLPLTFILVLATLLFRRFVYDKIVLPCILFVAFLEPVYQIVFMDTYPFWAMGVVGLNLYLFNVVQLLIFKKYGFLSMYLLRLIYYLFWHIIWGELRLPILFD